MLVSGIGQHESVITLCTYLFSLEPASPPCLVWTLSCVIKQALPFLISMCFRLIWKKKHSYRTVPHLILYFLSSTYHNWVQFSHSVLSDSLWPHGLQYARFPCPLPTPRAYSNSCPLSQWCHPTISSSVPLLLLPSIFPRTRIFPSDLSHLCIRYSKYWSFAFSISASDEYSGLISFGIDWLYLLAVQVTEI